MARRGGKNRGVRARQRAEAEQREALERSWRERREPAPELAAMVTFEQSAAAPRHRWLPYRQGLSCRLLGLMLSEAGAVRGPVLDPFAGSGTVPLAAAQAGLQGVGVEAIDALTFLATQKGAGARELPPLPDCTARGEFEDWSLTDPLHVAALLAAAGRTVSGSGRERSDAGTPAALIRQTLAMIREDLADPVPGRLMMINGDARRLPLATASVGAVLTSPPYLVRYDYAAVNARIQALYRGGSGTDRRRLVRAHRQAPSGKRGGPRHPAVAEAVAQLKGAGEHKLAGVTRGYFDDLAAAIGELARVLRPGAPAWVVIGGAFLKKVYLPSDLILAEQAERAGLRVERLLEARRLSTSGRALGSMGPVDSRESVLCLRKE